VVVKYSLPREVDKTRLIRFECCAAPICLMFCVRHNRVLIGLCVLLHIVAYYPRIKVVDETEDPTVPIDLPFEKVGIIEDVEEWRKRGAIT
jgi:hypothetical protein